LQAQHPLAEAHGDVNAPLLSAIIGGWLYGVTHHIVS